MVYKMTAEGDQADKNHQVTVNTGSELKKITRQEGDQTSSFVYLGIR
jgi:hypothetical protein